jgi:hypothetical protein
VAYGLETGIWTSPLVRQVIEAEFGPRYHAGHVRKLLQQLGYSVQRPTTKLVQADVKQHRKWMRHTYPNLKKNAKNEGAVIVFEDEASFRQTNPACDLGQTRKSTTDPHARGAQHTKDFRGRPLGQRQFHLPPSGGLFSVGNLSGFPGASGRARFLPPPPPPHLPNPRQRIVSQEAGNL